MNDTTDWSQANSWQYARWVWNIARNARITNPDPTAEVNLAIFIRIFVTVMYNPATGLGTRPWLDNKFRRLAVGAVGEYKGSPLTEPMEVVVKMLNVVGRDFKKVPLTAYEKAGADILIGYCANRHLGIGPYFGGVIGDGAFSDPLSLPV